jgi:hypothetical protein
MVDLAGADPYTLIFAAPLAALRRRIQLKDDLHHFPPRWLRRHAKIRPPYRP